MATEPNREETLFAAALRLPAGERAAFLDRECGGDTQLRQRVEATTFRSPSDSFLVVNTSVSPPLFSRDGRLIAAANGQGDTVTEVVGS
jgi:hypothetical protein